MAHEEAAAAVKLGPIALFNERRRRERSGEPAECQPAACEEPDAASHLPVLGTRAGTLLETPLLQPVQSLPEPEPPPTASGYPAECQLAAHDSDAMQCGGSAWHADRAAAGDAAAAAGGRAGGVLAGV